MGVIKKVQRTEILGFYQAYIKFNEVRVFQQTLIIPILMKYTPPTRFVKPVRFRYLKISYITEFD